MPGEQPWIQKGPEVDLKIPCTNLAVVLMQKLRRHPEAVTLTDETTGEVVTYQEMSRRALSVAFELRARGIKTGDVIVTALDNCTEFTDLLLGTMYAGAVFAPVNPDLHEADMHHLLRLLRPRIAFVVPRAASKVREALPPAAQLLLPEDQDDEWLAFLRHEPDPATFPPDAQCTADDTAVIMPSSGTTGPPKGVELTHRALLTTLVLSGHAVVTDPQIQITHIMVSPGFWMSGFFTSLVCLYSGIKLVLLRGFEVKTLLQSVEKYKANILVLSPFQIVQIIKHPDLEKYDLSTLTWLSYGGASLSLAMRDLAEKKLQKSLTQVYGLTESLFTVMSGPKNGQKPGTVGIPAPTTSIKVIDVETGKIVGPNTEGELCFKGPNSFKGYYRNPKATAEMIDSEGWIHSGDIGYFDEDGYFFVLDRIKELIKQKGIQIVPGDIESVLLTHPGVKDSAVVGIEHDTEQEQAVGFVVKQPDVAVSEAELLDLVKAELPDYKWLNGGLHFIDQIPRTASGKVLRRELRQRARSLRLQNTKLDTSVQQICESLKNITNSAEDSKPRNHTVS